MKKHFCLLTIALLALAFAQGQQVVALRCEMRTDPQGIDIRKPRLGWQINAEQRNVQQTGWQVLVATSKEKLEKNEGDAWNSGMVSSATSVHIPYAGKPLESGRAYFWKVKVQTNRGESAWSRPASFTMGLLNKAGTTGGWKAKWIGYDQASPWDSVTQWSRLSARYFRKQFSAEGAIRRATVYVSGLGLYELFINGKRTGDQVLAPAPTDYRKSVLYNTYDVTNALKGGKNAIAAVVGNGRFFTMRQNYKTQKHNTFGYPKLLLQLEIEYANGKTQTITSDESWKLNVDGPIRTNNEYDGEEYDATKEFNGWMQAGFDDRKWIKPQLVAAPAGTLQAQLNEPMKIMGSVLPVSIKKAGEGKFIMDMGQNFSGWIKMRVKGERGKAVSLRFAESLQANGELYVANLRDAKVTDIYTLKGSGVEEWEPSFVYHGFRYVEITGYPGTPTVRDFEGKLVYDDLQTTGQFESSDAVLNKIHRNAWWGIASNYKGMPVDCPQRNERQPWLGDRATGSGGEAFLFGNANLYAKWLDDIEESQTPEGAIPDVAPAFWNYYTDNVTWPGTYLLVADMLHRQYADDQPIKKHYASMKKWMQYMQAKYMKGFIVTKDKYGDWCVPPESLEIIRSRDSLRTTNGELISTAYYYRLLQLMKQFAAISGASEDIKAYDKLGEEIKSAFNKKFYKNARYCYDNNTITANLLPLYFGMTPDSLKTAIFKNIYERITVKDSMHISTGVIGTQWLMRGLTDNGHADIAFALASNKTYPSWGYMTEQGATTIWELWNGNTANPQMNSQNHVMLLGDLLIWLYEDVAGIYSTNGFSDITMKPGFVKGLSSLNASYASIHGTIDSRWAKQNGRLSWDIRIPANTKATVYIPANLVTDITEGGKAIGNVEGIRFVKLENGHAVLEIGSGNYSFGSIIQ